MGKCQALWGANMGMGECRVLWGANMGECRAYNVPLIHCRIVEVRTVELKDHCVTGYLYVAKVQG